MKASIIITGKAVFTVRTAPEALQSDINKAIEILEAAGCSECYIFGSVADGWVHDDRT